jgi:hypothetical protein
MKFIVQCGTNDFHEEIVSFTQEFTEEKIAEEFAENARNNMLWDFVRIIIEN